MPYLLDDLVVDRVDFVDEGADSAAFIEFFKRKEPEEHMNVSEILELLTPEHSEVVQKELTSLNDALTAASDELEKVKAEKELLEKQLGCECDGEADENGVCKSCGRQKKTVDNTDDSEETVLKSMPEGIREAYLKMREQKEAAEEQVRKAAEKEAEAEAVAKAATMKALPVSQEELVEILKNCDPKVTELLAAAAVAIEGTVLDEVGKSRDGKADDSSDDAWSKIEAEANKIAARDSVTKQKAIGIAIQEHPDLYREYLKGGTN